MARFYKRRDLKRKQEEAGKLLGKVLLGANGPNLSNKRKRLHSLEPGEREEVINAANHFHRHRSQHSSLGQRHMLPLIV